MQLFLFGPSQHIFETILLRLVWLMRPSFFFFFVCTYSLLGILAYIFFPIVSTLSPLMWDQYPKFNLCQSSGLNTDNAKVAQFPQNQCYQLYLIWIDLCSKFAIMFGVNLEISNSLTIIYELAIFPKLTFFLRYPFWPHFVTQSRQNAFRMLIWNSICEIECDWKMVIVFKMR